MKRIGLHTMGSEGDVNPFLALSGALSNAGYAVTLFITGHDARDYSVYEEKLGITIEHIGDFDKEAFDNLLKGMTKLSTFKQAMQMMEFFLYSKVDILFEAAERLCKENDLVIGHGMNFPLVLEAKKQNRDYVSLMPTAVAMPTDDYPPMGLPDLGRFGNRLQWRLTSGISNLLFKKKINSYSSTYNFNPITDYTKEIGASQVLNLIALTPTLFPYRSGPFEKVHFTGFFNNQNLDSISYLPEDLEAFLAGDDPVGFITIGSITTVETEPEKLVKIFIEAAELAKVKVVLQYDWTQVQNSKESSFVYKVGRIPHHTVFPRCSFVVHHGGAGTMQTSLLAGCPSIVVSYGADQFFNGAALKRAGVCKDVMGRGKVSVYSLAKAMRNLVVDESYKQRAMELSKVQQKEDGLQTAVDLIRGVLPLN